MGSYYSVNGVIPLKPDTPPAAIAALREAACEGVVERSQGWPNELWVNICGEMSASSACAVDAALEAFAVQYASAGAVLRSEYESEDSLLVVGPDRDSEIRAEIEHWQGKARELASVLEALQLELDQLNGEVPYGN